MGLALGGKQGAHPQSPLHFGTPIRDRRGARACYQWLLEQWLRSKCGGAARLDTVSVCLSVLGFLATEPREPPIPSGLGAGVTGVGLLRLVLWRCWPRGSEPHVLLTGALPTEACPQATFMPSPSRPKRKNKMRPAVYMEYTPRLTLHSVSL